MIYYDAGGKGPLTVYGIYFIDIGGGVLQQALASCAQANPDGSRSLNPGQYCFVRAQRGANSFVSKVVLAHGNATAANITGNVRTSVELRDANDAPIEHVELR